MSPALSFSALEILQGLLDKTKCQTIRPIGCDCGTCKKIGAMHLKENIVAVISGRQCGKNYLAKQAKHYFVKRTPRLKVGDKVKLYWKMRSKRKWFCRDCGKGLRGKDILTGKCCTNPFAITQEAKEHRFPKLLGTGEITEVFKIEMKSHEDGDGIVKYPEIGWWNGFSVKVQELAHKDGFDSVTKMFKWFDKHYNLSHPKRFAVYRWRWV